MLSITAPISSNAFAVPYSHFLRFARAGSTHCSASTGPTPYTLAIYPSVLTARTDSLDALCTSLLSSPSLALAVP